jgi:hypothetical protein
LGEAAFLNLISNPDAIAFKSVKRAIRCLTSFGEESICYEASSALPFRDTLGENKDVSKGITDVKFFEAPGLRFDLRRNNHIGRQILLVQGLDITHSDPERSVAWGRLIRGVEMELHCVSLNDHKPLLLKCAGKANSFIKGQGLLRISHGEARSDRVKDWPTRWCVCHVMLFLSRLQRSGAR